MSLEPSLSAAPARPPNRYDRMEWAGAFGDLGTLIPFVAAYIGVLKLDPFGVLFAFGISMVVCGLYYKTPFPVQPMKAIGAVASIQAVQTAVVTPAAVYSAALATGAIWFILGISGLMGRVAKFVPPAVVIGIVLGLGWLHAPGCQDDANRLGDRSHRDGRYIDADGQSNGAGDVCPADIRRRGGGSAAP